MRVVTLLIAVLACICAPVAAEMSTVQNKPFTIVTTFPFGTFDLIARKFGEKITEATNQSIIVDARPSAGGIVATTTAARAKPDGHTMLLTTANLSIAKSLYRKLPYDRENALRPLAQIVQTPNIIVVRSDSPYRNLGDLLAAAQASPEKLSYASLGVGSFQHLAMELMKKQFDFGMMHVPYGGSSQAWLALLGGDIDVYATNISEAIPNIDTGKVRALAITSNRRSPILPDLPTIAELTGKTDFEVVGWIGFLAPKATPDLMVEKMAKIITDTAKTEEMRGWLEKEGFLLSAAGPEQFKVILDKDERHWADIIQQLGIKAD